MTAELMPVRGAFVGLTDREEHVLRLMAAGLSNNAIGQASYVSTKTVESYIARIFIKLGLDEDPHVNRRVQAVVVYLAAQKSVA